MLILEHAPESAHAARDRDRPWHGEHRPVRARRRPRLPRSIAAHRPKRSPILRVIVELLDDAHRAAPLDLVAGPSGYGLPLTAARDLTENDLRLAYLAADGEPGGIGGLRSLMRMLARSSMPVVLTPGVVHLPSVPAHRKVNRVDMGTADKVCAAALAMREQVERRGCGERDVSFILLELGGAFTAAIAVQDGSIVDGAGGTSGPLGVRAAGALDGEVAFLAGSVSKRLLFGGGAATIAGAPDASAEALAAPGTPRGRLAWEAYVESAVKAVAALAVSAPRALRSDPVRTAGPRSGVRDELARRLAGVIADASGARAHRLRDGGQAGGPGRRSRRRRACGRPVGGARGCAGHSRGVRHGARSSARDLSGRGTGAPRDFMKARPSAGPRRPRRNTRETDFVSERLKRDGTRTSGLLRVLRDLRVSWLHLFLLRRA